MKPFAKILVLCLSGLFLVWEITLGIPGWLQLGMMVGVLLTVGIPHGALDHEVEQTWARRADRPFALPAFLIRYIGWIAVLVLLWWWMPVISLLAFLGVSAFHFGETDLRTKTETGNPVLNTAMYLSYGLTWLMVILLPNLGEAREIVFHLSEGITDAPGVWHWLENYRYGILVAGGGLTGGCLLLHPARKDLMRRVPWMLGLALILWQLPLLISFSLYFGGWHSLTALGDIRRFLSTTGEEWSWKKMMVKIAPLGVLSLVGLGMIAGLGYLLLNPFMIVFIFISVLTVPHTEVMGKMYKENQREFSSK